MKERLDLSLVRRGLAETRERAQALILAGQVEVDGQVVTKVATPLRPEAQVSIRQPLPYVGRGGFKLAAALDHFELEVQGCVCADVGASTGGFTDVLLQRGAARVYAIDVGYGQLAWKLRQDPRVHVLDRTNIRYLERLPEEIDLVTIDVSFISLELVLERVAGADGKPPLVRRNGDIVALVKPQFEAGRGQVGRGGIVRDPVVHRRVLVRVCEAAETMGLVVVDLCESPILGTEGNREFLLHLQAKDQGHGPDWRADLERLVG